MNVLMCGSHSDDLEISVGGTATKLVKQGHEVDFLLICNLSRIKDITKRLEEAEEAAKIIGAKLLTINLQESPFRDIPRAELVSQLDMFFSKKPYQKVFIPCYCDSHQDHEFVAKVLFSVCRKNTCDLFSYEACIPSGIVPYPFVFNYFVDISSEIKTKMDAINCHKSQLESYGEGWITAIEARSRFWGQKINTRYVEAFQAIKIIER